MEKKASFRNVFALGLVSFFTDISSEMVFSLIPTFLLGLPGSNIALLGLVEGTAESLSYGLRAVSGVFSDKFRKRKTLVLIGYAMSTLIKPLLSIARSVTDLFPRRVEISPANPHFPLGYIGIQRAFVPNTSWSTFPCVHM